VESTPVDSASAPKAEAQADAVDAERLRTFRSLKLRYDPRAGAAYEGPSREPLAREDLYKRLGREDLVERDESRRTQRIFFFTGAGAALVAGIAGGVVILNGSPDMNSEACSLTAAGQHKCVAESNRANALSGVAMISGALLATGLLTVGLSLGSSPLPARETESLVATYNGELMRRLKAPSAAPATPSGSRLEITPQVSASGGGLVGRLTF
jgi:hypothetical protein